MAIRKTCLSVPDRRALRSAFAEVLSVGGLSTGLALSTHSSVTAIIQLP